MRINAKLNSILVDKKNHAHVNLLVSNYRHVTWLDELEQDVEYSVEIKKVKSQRSLQQNKYMWELLHQLERTTREIAMDWYIKALTETGAVVDYVWGTEDTEHTLKKSFRAVQRVKAHKIKDSEGWLYRVIVGSSKFNIEEMNQLLDTVIRYCNEHNIDTEVYQ
jgi:hypothetical protein